ncbi:hypothetical protein I553_1264 [Mycobacterium xenopi 4042]|uniref:Uncharacterized protein n=1 Tax=Mycobacterium xenopi 4042 TaxID=1299334 RepID=X8CFQ4_MYCXE|nr:hypothetical protein I553_1264 [Mycobacterium xenopi 4042]
MPSAARAAALGSVEVLRLMDRDWAPLNRASERRSIMPVPG